MQLGLPYVSTSLDTTVMCPMRVILMNKPRQSITCFLSIAAHLAASDVKCKCRPTCFSIATIRASYPRSNCPASCSTAHRRQSWEGLGVATPRFLAGGSLGVAGGSQGGSGWWTGRKILLYLNMYRKYVRKCRLLKRNRMICLEIAVK